MDNIDTPTTEWHNRRECHCGCDTFRFRAGDLQNILSANECRNCGHTLASHINLIRSRQAE